MSLDSYRRAAGACAAISLLAAATGCSETAEEPVLPGVLEQVRFTALPPDGITFVDAERARDLLDAEPGRFAFLEGFGTPLLSTTEVPEHRYGLDPEVARATVTVGFHDPYGYWMGHFDQDDITGALTADGFAEEDGVWRNAEDGVTIQVSEDQIAWGNEEFNPARLTEGRSLAESDHYRHLADCLGEVYRADFVQREEDGAVPVYAYGHLAESPSETSTVLCAVTDGEQTAEEAAESLRTVIEDNPDRYEGAEVTGLDGDSPGVRVTVPDTGEEQEPGRLLTSDIDLMQALTGVGTS